MNDLEALIERIKRDAGITDPEQVALLARTATRATELGARAALGEDVSHELAIVKATAMNLEERALNAISLHLPNYLNNVFIGVLTKILL